MGHYGNTTPRRPYLTIKVFENILEHLEVKYAEHLQDLIPFTVSLAHQPANIPKKDAGHGPHFDPTDFKAIIVYIIDGSAILGLYEPNAAKASYEMTLKAKDLYLLTKKGVTHLMHGISAPSDRKARSVMVIRYVDQANYEEVKQKAQTEGRV